MKKESIVIVDDLEDELEDLNERKKEVIDFWFKKVFTSTSKDGVVSLGRIP